MCAYRGYDTFCLYLFIHKRRLICPEGRVVVKQMRFKSNELHAEYMLLLLLGDNPSEGHGVGFKQPGARGKHDVGGLRLRDQ